MQRRAFPPFAVGSGRVGSGRVGCAECTQCPMGSYQPNASSTSCFSCTAGYFTGKPGDALRASAPPSFASVVLWHLASCCARLPSLSSRLHPPVPAGTRAHYGGPVPYGLQCPVSEHRRVPFCRRRRVGRFVRWLGSCVFVCAAVRVSFAAPRRPCLRSHPVATAGLGSRVAGLPACFNCDDVGDVYQAPQYPTRRGRVLAARYPAWRSVPRCAVSIPHHWAVH